MIKRMGKTSRFGAWLSVLALILIVSPAIAVAQENLGRGRVTGIIKDQAGNPLQNVIVVAKSIDGKTMLDAKTDKKGRFAIAGFGTGQWQFTATMEGFMPETKTVQVNQLKPNDPLELVLKPASAAATAAPAAAEGNPALKSFEAGNALMKEEKYAEAIVLFEEFLVKYPEVYQARLNIATAAMKMGDNARAETEFNTVLGIALPADPLAKKDNESAIRALSGLGDMALKKGDFETAQKYFAQALEISPKDEAAAYNVAEIFFSNQKMDDAVKYFQMAIQIKPSWSKPYYKLGMVYLNKGDYPKAIEMLNKFIELDPQSPDAATAKNIVSAVEKMKK